MKNIVVLIADDKVDRNGDIMDPAGLTVKSEVPVTLGFQPNAKFMGMAKLRVEGNKVLADFEFSDKDLPMDDLTPAVGGVVLGREGNKITKAEIRMVSVSFDRNADDRIKNFGSNK